MGNPPALRGDKGILEREKGCLEVSWDRLTKDSENQAKEPGRRGVGDGRANTA